jgi:hypothetical protein
MTTITALPAPPDPNADDASTFSAKAATFTQALPTFGLQANAVASEVNGFAADARNASTVAVGAANYRGEWSAATAYTTGQSVSYLNQRFIAKVNNTNVIPVNGATWLFIGGVAADSLTAIRNGVI